MIRIFAAQIAIATLLCPSLAVLGQADGSQPESPASAVVVNPPPPKTHLQAMAEQKGALIVAGYTDVGTVQRDDGASVRITAAEYTNTVTSSKQYGLIVFIHQVDGGTRDTRSYIDDDEVDTLLSALDSMSRIDRTATQLNDFDARFRTRGDLEIANVNNGGVREVAFHGVEIISSSGQEIWASTHLPLARLAEVVQYLNAGKQVIDKVKQNK